MVRKYDVSTVLVHLANGLSREEISKEFGLVGYRTMDNYMKSQGYRWVEDAQTYKLVKTYMPGVKVGVEIGERVPEIIEAFEEGLEASEIVERFGFKSNREMSKFMKESGFKWDNEVENYIPLYEASGAKKEREPNKRTQGAKISERLTIEELVFLKKIMPYQEELLAMLEVKSALDPAFPHYELNGTSHSKSVQITNSLQDLVVDFVNENKISQKQLFEIALIEFFQKYGYEQELSKVLRYANKRFTVA